MKTNVQNEDDLLIHKVKNGDEGAFKFLMTNITQEFMHLFLHIQNQEKTLKILLN